MVVLKDLQKNYGDSNPILNNACLELSDGTVFALVASDGKGKTSLLQILSGVIPKDGGQVFVDGQDPYENVVCKREIFFVPEEPFFAWNMTVRDLSNWYAALYSFDRAVFDDYLRTFKIEEKTYLRSVSKGIQKQVFAALAFAIAPKYLFFDEIFEGVDPLTERIIKRGIQAWLKKRNGVAVLVSRSFAGLGGICNRFGVLRDGAILTFEEAEQGDLHKFQAAFDERVSESDFPFSCLFFRQSGKVVRLIAKGRGADIQTQIERMQPLFVEEIPLRVEDFFLETTYGKEGLR